MTGDCSHSNYKNKQETNDHIQALVTMLLLHPWDTWVVKQIKYYAKDTGEKNKGLCGTSIQKTGALACQENLDV